MTYLYSTALLVAAVTLSAPALADKPTASAIYDLTKTAKTSKDFTAIVKKCDAANEGVEGGLDLSLIHI